MAGRLRLALVTLMVALGMGIATALPAHALTDGIAIPHQYVSSTYKGWGYPVAAIAGDRRVVAWRWTGNDWQQESMAVGSRVYVYPFASGWSWAWFRPRDAADGSWYAVRTARLARSTCTSDSTAVFINSGLTTDSQVGVVRPVDPATDDNVAFWNPAVDLKSRAYVGVRRGETVRATRACRELFPDASLPLGAPSAREAWVRVSVQVGTWQRGIASCLGCRPFWVFAPDSRGAQVAYVQAGNLRLGM